MTTSGYYLIVIVSVNSRKNHPWILISVRKTDGNERKYTYFQKYSPRHFEVHREETRGPPL